MPYILKSLRASSHGICLLSYSYCSSKSGDIPNCSATLCKLSLWFNLASRNLILGLDISSCIPSSRPLIYNLFVTIEYCGGKRWHLRSGSVNCDPSVSGPAWHRLSYVIDWNSSVSMSRHHTYQILKITGGRRQVTWCLRPCRSYSIVTWMIFTATDGESDAADAALPDPKVHLYV